MLLISSRSKTLNRVVARVTEASEKYLRVDKLWFTEVVQYLACRLLDQAVLDWFDSGGIVLTLITTTS